jgi:hypothetical protein
MRNLAWTSLFLVALAAACGPTSTVGGDDDDDDGPPDAGGPPPTGTDCDDDDNLEGCACNPPGNVRACWPDSLPTDQRGVGACQPGSQVCTASEDVTPTWGPCNGTTVPTDDVSVDGADQDCDGDDGDQNCQPESCTDSADNDCDGQSDCGDIDCSSDTACNPCPGTSENCADGIDNDCDGLVDCFDFINCWTNPACIPECFIEDCGNGKDDDCDGQTDCLDAECGSTPECGCTCVPGTQRWCDTPTACTWGIQNCLPDGSWGTCSETPPPSACTGGTLYDTDCCLAQPMACCQDFHDTDGDGDNWESLGECSGISVCP